MTKDEMFKKWMEALRSGEYKQVQGTLMGKTPDGEVGYCCLGVFNDLFKLGEMQVEIEDEKYFLKQGPGETYEKITEQLGHSVSNSGIAMNDKGYSFTKIADRLEAAWPYEKPKDSPERP